MKTIKQSLIILLVILVVTTVASNWYFGTSTSGIPPTISCPEGVLEISVNDKRNPEVLLQGMVATDEQDGDLTDRIIVDDCSKLITNDTAKVTYWVFDSDNNVATCVRKVRFTDYHRPTFQVIEPLVYSSIDEVTMLSRLKATDVLEEDISENIRISTLEPTKHSEVFNVTIQVSNGMGDTSYVTLPVVIQASNFLRPEIQLREYLVYLNKGEKFVPTEYIDDLRVPTVTNPPLHDIVIDNPVDTGKAGTYYVTYSYSANGCTGMAILTVVVQ